MAERAIIAAKGSDIGLYLHWHGTRTWVEAYLEYCRRRRFKSPAAFEHLPSDPYGWARLAQVVANHMGPDGLSVGIDAIERLPAPHENGTYLIGGSSGWEVLEAPDAGEDDLDLESLIDEIDQAQPQDQRLSNARLSHLMG